MKRRFSPIWLVGLLLLLAALACSAAAASRTFSVAIQSPADGTLLPIDMPTTVNMQAVDPAGPGVAYIELFVDGESRWTSDQTLGPQGTLNAEVTWTPDAEGPHTLMAIAYREDGSASPPATVEITAVALTPLDEADDEEANDDEEATVEATEESTVESAGAPPPGANAPVNPSAGVQARVDTGAFVRAGPGPFCEEIGGVEAGNTITVYELSQDGYWYKTDFLGEDKVGWVWIDLVTVTGNASAIPQGNVPGCIGCGDEICNGDETCYTCAGDCGECCGNGTCEPDFEEDCGTCEADCGKCCGNDVCEEDRDETCDTCEEDCGECCGDGTCTAAYGEHPFSCPADCDTCGNGYCVTANGENCVNCPGDCQVCCGDRYCGAGESVASCEMDCGDICGDGTCDPAKLERCWNCPEDCGICNPAASSSDRALKENIEPVDNREVLETLMSVPIARWSYIEDGDAVTHMGPMAQDFYGAYGLGDGDKTIYMLDSGGVSMASIQALYEIVQEQQTQLDALAARQARFVRLAIPALAGVLVLIGGAFAGGVWAGRRRR